jgi:hypothetical protein
MTSSASRRFLVGGDGAAAAWDMTSVLSASMAVSGGSMTHARAPARRFAAFIENAVFAPARPRGIRLETGWRNGQPAFASYEPDGYGRLAASGLQVLQFAN